MIPDDQISPPNVMHEAMELSLCDEGMCFASPVAHQIGTVLMLDFDPEESNSSISLQCEGVVVDCQLAQCGLDYEITVIFTKD